MTSLAIFVAEFDGSQIRITPDGRFSVFDVLVAFGVAATKQNAATVLSRIEKQHPEVVGKGINPRQLFGDATRRYPELQLKVSTYKFPGRGQRETPVATQEVCEEILRVLGRHPSQDKVVSDQFYPRTESQIVSVLEKAFADLRPVPQFRVNGYRIDLYLAKVNIAIEVDEFGHKSYDQQKEHLRERSIKSALGCSFVRFDPYLPSFNIGDVIYQVRGLI